VWRQLLQVLLQPVEVGVQAQRPAVARDDAREDLVVEHLVALLGAELLPQPVVAGRRPRMGEPVDAAIDHMLAAPPS